jgi:hypothetical protein
MNTSVLPSETSTAAADGLKQRLAAEGLADVEVSIGTGATNRPTFGHVRDGMRDEITIAIKGQAVENLDTETLRKKTYSALGTIDALNQHVTFDETGEHLDKLKDRLRSFIAKGAKIPENYLKWGGFDKDLNKDNKWHSTTEDHAIQSLNGDATGIRFSISAPETEKAKDKQPIVESGENKIDTYINGNTANIKTLLVARLQMEKYLGPKDDNAKAEIKKKVDDLTIESKNGYVKIMSPEQKAESDRLKDLKAESLKPEEEKKLAETNILSKLTTEKLGKILGRSFLHSGATADEIFPVIAGREDMKRAVERQLKVLKYSAAGQSDPELAKSVDDFLADAVFKKHEYHGRVKLRQPPDFEKSSDPEKMGMATITLSLPKGEGAKTLAALGNNVSVTQNTTQPITAVTTDNSGALAGAVAATAGNGNVSVAGAATAQDQALAAAIVAGAGTTTQLGAVNKTSTLDPSVAAAVAGVSATGTSPTR